MQYQNITVHLLARDVIYTYRAYATMSVPVCLSVTVTEVHSRIIANLGFKFRSNFTALVVEGRGHLNNISHSRTINQSINLFNQLCTKHVYGTRNDIKHTDRHRQATRKAHLSWSPK